MGERYGHRYTCKEKNYFYSFLEKAVKRIIYSDGTIQNLGCTKHTTQCKEKAHYDKKRNLRINTPPCCLQNLQEVFQQTTRELQDLNVKHLLVFGGVIGWIRNKGIIPYEEDLDLWIDGTFWKSERMEQFRKTLSKSYGLETMYKQGGDRLWILYSKKNYIGLGVWPYKIGETISYPYPGGKRHPYNNIFPLKYVNFSGIPTYIPNNPEGFCDIVYGKGKWEDELNCTSHSDRKCIA